MPPTARTPRPAVDARQAARTCTRLPHRRPLPPPCPRPRRQVAPRVRAPRGCCAAARRVFSAAYMSACGCSPEVQGALVTVSLDAVDTLFNLTRSKCAAPAAAEFPADCLSSGSAAAAAGRADARDLISVQGVGKVPIGGEGSPCESTVCAKTAVCPTLRNGRPNNGYARNLLRAQNNGYLGACDTAAGIPPGALLGAGGEAAAAVQRSPAAGAARLRAAWGARCKQGGRLGGATAAPPARCRRGRYCHIRPPTWARPRLWPAPIPAAPRHLGVSAPHHARHRPLKPRPPASPARPLARRAGTNMTKLPRTVGTSSCSNKTLGTNHTGIIFNATTGCFRTCSPFGE